MMKWLAALAIGLTLSLGACSTDPSKGPTYPVVGTVDQTKMEQAAFAARSTYAGVLRLMAEYVQLPRCGSPASPQVCSFQGAVNEMRKVELAADTATKGAVDIARSPTKSPVALANAVTDANRAVETFRAVVAVYKPQAKEVK